MWILFVMGAVVFIAVLFALVNSKHVPEPGSMMDTHNKIVERDAERLREMMAEDRKNRKAH